MIAEASRLPTVPFALCRAVSGKYPLLSEILPNPFPNLSPVNWRRAIDGRGGLGGTLPPLKGGRAR